jgi:hypothetical protein
MDRDLVYAIDALKNPRFAIQELGHPKTLTERPVRTGISMQARPRGHGYLKETAETFVVLAPNWRTACEQLPVGHTREQGVRFVQLFDWGWDFHGTGPGEGLQEGLTNKWAATDKPIAALIKDLRQRGLLDETLIIWGGEFGRTPFREGRTAAPQLGRDHYRTALRWMAGGRQSGIGYGQTDELGFGVVENESTARSQADYASARFQS